MTVTPMPEPRQQPTRLCSQCDNVVVSRSLLQCGLLGGAIWDETEAQDCLGYDEVR